jgi:hypothetical protein
MRRSRRRAWKWGLARTSWHKMVPSLVTKVQTPIRFSQKYKHLQSSGYMHIVFIQFSEANGFCPNSAAWVRHTSLVYKPVSTVQSYEMQ